jgi:hypothetical protein
MISKKVSNIIFKSIGHKTIRFLEPIKYADSTGDVKKVYDEISYDYVLAAPFTLHASNPKIMAGSWSLVRESLIVNGEVNRLTKEAIAGGVSISNQCQYCLEAHIKMSGGKIDEKNKDLFEWSKSHYKDNELIQNPPFSIDEAPEIIGTALTFHYINRMVSVFVTEYPLPLPGFLYWLKPFISSFFKNTAAVNITGVKALPGQSLKWLAPVEVSTEFLWAESNIHIKNSFLGFDKLMDQTAENVIPPNVQEVVLNYLADWTGNSLGFGNEWIDNMTKDLVPSEKIIAQFILLIATMPYKITNLHIDELRKNGIGNEELLIISSWGSWQATKKIGNWISAPFSIVRE